jgi:hypothetical protein
LSPWLHVIGVCSLIAPRHVLHIKQHTTCARAPLHRPPSCTTAALCLCKGSLFLSLSLSLSLSSSLSLFRPLTVARRALCADSTPTHSTAARAPANGGSREKVSESERETTVVINEDERKEK